MVFRVGVGKKIGGVNFYLGKTLNGSSSKARIPSAKDHKDRDLQDFLYKAEDDVNENIMNFFVLNGYDPSRLRRERIDLDDLFAGDESYETFSELVLSAKEAVEKVAYSGDTGIQAKRDIAEKVFELKGFISRYNPKEHFNPTYQFLHEPELIPEPVKKLNWLEKFNLFLSNETNFSDLNRANQVAASLLKKVLLVVLWIGILIMPYIFAWFTLGKSFGKKSRIVAFGWLVVMVLILVFGDTASNGQ